MDIKETKKEYLPIRLLDSDEKGTIEVVESNGRKYVLRTMNGKIGSYIALKNISSPYLSKIESAEYKNGKTIVVEEYIEGEKNISSLTDERAIVSAFCELCDVLTLLHSRGIIHRDIKPSNILIAPDGHIRLIDFDASRYYDDSKDNDTCYLGTKGYAPPEQFGYSQTNATADIYSLGVTLKNVLGDKAEKRKYSRIIRKCTEFDPKNRYPSAAAVKKALRSENMAFMLPILLVLAAAGLTLYFLMYSPAAEHKDTEIDTLLNDTVTVSSETPSETKLTTLAALKTSSVTSSETTVPTTEETTAVPETELTSETEESTVTAETSETQIETSSSETTVTSTASHTSKTTKTTKRTEKTTSAATTITTTVKETEPTTTTAATSAPAGTMLMVCTTDKLRTPVSSVVRINGRNFDELAEPWTFIPDEAVIGEWKYLTSTGQGAEIYDKMYYKKIVSDPKNATYPQSLYFYTDGICKFKTVYPSSGAVYSDPLEWTYGLIATPAVQEYYFYEHYYIYSADDGKEYLFVERKNGDYMNADSPSDGLHYMIYERSTEE